MKVNGRVQLNPPGSSVCGSSWLEWSLTEDLVRTSETLYKDPIRKFGCEINNIIEFNIFSVDA